MVVVGHGSTVSRAPRRHDIRGWLAAARSVSAAATGRLPRRTALRSSHCRRSRSRIRLLSVRLADADRKAELLGLLVERHVLGRRRAQPVIARAIAAPIVVDLGEHDPGAVAGPHRLADADLGDRLDVLAGREVADPQLEPLRPVIVRQRREQLAVRADLERTEAEIIACPRPRPVRRRSARPSPPATGLRYQLRYCAPGLNAHQ